MDAHHFDALARSLVTGANRRVVVGIGLGKLLALAGGSAAAKKRRPKKCKGNKKKCGSKCIARTACCNDASCGDGGVCQSRACVCFTGFKPCQGKCIAEERCCVDADCQEGGSCRSGTCRCFPGFKPCNGVCIDAELCCEQADCGTGNLCLANGTCAKACGGGVACGAPCACSTLNTEGQSLCVAGTFGDCGAQTCESTADCPLGSHCQNLTGCPPSRCTLLCAT